MHNRKKGSISAAKQAALQERGAQYAALSRAAMSLRAARQYDGAALEASARVLGLNPEHYSLWGYRREILRALHPRAEDEGALAAELELTQAGLSANPKSYCVWHHRRWVVTQWAQPTPERLARELKLCAKLLELDARNFHCWGYRRHLAALAASPPSAELRFTDGKIGSDFSNYSAWHARATLRPSLGEGDGRGGAAAAAAEAGGGAPLPTGVPALRAELELVRNALYTAPEDSSAWFYHAWLLQRAAHIAAAGAEEAAAAREALEGEVGVADELLGLEPNLKWPMLAGARASLLLARAGGGGRAVAKARGWLLTLQQADAQRQGYYAHLLAQLPPEA